MRNVSMPVLSDLLFTIVSGFVERSNDDLHAVVITRSPSMEGQRISESIGIDRMELWSDAAELADDQSHPTVFSYRASYTIPPSRTGMLGMRRYPNPLPCNVSTTVRAYLDGSCIKGDFDARITVGVANQSIPVTIRGTLEAVVD